jgi:hypothetical protein
MCLRLIKSCSVTYMTVSRLLLGLPFRDEKCSYLNLSILLGNLQGLQNLEHPTGQGFQSKVVRLWASQGGANWNKHSCLNCGMSTPIILESI